MHNSLTLGPRLWLGIPRHLQFDGHCTDCPCACPALMVASGNEISSKKFLQEVDIAAIKDICLNQDIFVNHIDEHMLALSAKGRGLVVLNAEAKRLLDLSAPRTLNDLRVRFSRWPTDLFEQTIAILLALDVLSSPQAQNINTFHGESGTLAVWLNLTNQCNLLCKYCYITRNGQQMSTAIAQHSIDAVFRSALAYGYPRVKLKYTGGEPTLNFDTLYAVQRRAEMLSAQTGIGLEAVLLTNGIHITDTQIDTLLVHNILVMVSLDGIGQYQDIQRPLAGSEGSSFTLVDRTLDRLITRGISPYISVTITKPSFRGLPELVDYLLDRELQFSFNFYREPDCSLRQDELTFTSDEMTKGIQPVLQVIERRLPRYSLLSNLADRADLQVPHLRACGVGQSYIVIDCNGSVSKCQMDMKNPITNIDADDPLALIRSDTDRIQNLAVDQKECRQCVWRYRCTGGCPRWTFQRTGRYDAKSPLCEVYQAILPEVVRLEALRLIRYEEPWDFDLPLN